EEIYRIGGAQAVLSASFGLPNLPKVDKIVGPGNIYVATAKKIVYGKVDIDMIAGPSEILVIADTADKKDIKFIASDLLSQAEHDPLARAILVGTDKDFLLEVEKECYKTALELPENLKNNAVASLDNRGMIVKCSNMESVISLSNDLSSEHLEIFSDNPYPIFEKIRNAGSVFIGKYTPESVGDYIGGPNHVLPTSRSAKFFSPLGVYSFQKRTSFLEFSREGLSANYKHISNIARFENLISHARSAEIRFEK
ncbi:MAG TPA: histidinol dehydrogenase, partial [Spirochaetota bacterium]|nr:histidinol dehydrogenase [Spirochaetota bacterium]